MASTVKVPLLGTHSKGTVAGVAIGGVAVAGYLIYRQTRKAKADAAASSAATQAASGYGYGASAAYPGGYYGYGEPGGNYGYGASGGFSPTGYYGYGVPQPQSTPATTNAQWVQAAIAQLQGEGYNPMLVSGVLGAYVMGQPIAAHNVSIVQAAIGIEGYPPDPRPDGFPPGIHAEGTTGGGGGGGQGDKVRVPSVLGKRGEEAFDILAKAGLKDAQVPERTEGKRTRVVGQTPSAGRRVNSGSTVTVHVKTL